MSKKNEVKEVIDVEMAPVEEIPEENKAAVEKTAEVNEEYWIIRKPKFMTKKKDSEPKPKKDKNTIVEKIGKVGCWVALGLGALTGIAVMALRHTDDNTLGEISTTDDDYLNLEDPEGADFTELENNLGVSDENTDEVKSEVTE